MCLKRITCQLVSVRGQGLVSWAHYLHLQLQSCQFPVRADLKKIVICNSLIVLCSSVYDSGQLIKLHLSGGRAQIEQVTINMT